jgi:UDP-N-acetylmuramate dehydrogenase
MMAVPARIRERVALAPMTTLGVGGAARFFAEADGEDALGEALSWARASGIPSYILGGGSNVLISDAGLDGLVVRLAIRGVDVSSDVFSDGADTGNGVEVDVGAGEPFDPFVERCVRAGHAGLECLSGIPGSVGATPIQNVGAYGQEVGERIVAVRVMDRSTGSVHSMPASECRFSYRNSAFKEELRDKCIVLGVRFSLPRGGAPPLRYAELSREIAQRGVDPASLVAVRDAVLALRRSKSMVIDEADPNRRSVGSFFVNPIVDTREADRIEGLVGERMPRFAADGRVKLSAAWLIEHAGFPKGSGDATVGLSTRHALAIVNRGGASAAEILGFAVRVRQSVRARFGVALMHEPVLLGFTAKEVAELED